jgi:hypothetical protein
MGRPFAPRSVGTLQYPGCCTRQAPDTVAYSCISEPCTHRARPEEHCLQARCLSGVERDVPDGDVKVKKAAMTSKRPRVSGKMQQDQQDSSQDASNERLRSFLYRYSEYSSTGDTLLRGHLMHK